jgi:hypothetical protein
MTGRRALALAAAALAIGGTAYAWRHFPRDDTTRETVDHAVARFRHSAGRGGSRAGVGALGLGVYRYMTRGGERFSSPLIGSGHDYRGISTIAITSARCGVTERWQVLFERWTETRLCVGAGGSRLRSLHDYHEFFGNPQRTVYACTERPTPKHLWIGMRWSTRCVSRKGSISTATRVKSFGRARVGRQTFDFVRTESMVQLEGEVSGTGRQEDWRRRSDGLLLRRVASSGARIRAAGGGHYGERYSLELLSPIPKR